MGQSHLQGYPAGTHPRARLLVVHGLRQPDPLAASDRPEACRRRQHASGHREESGWRRHDLVRTQTPGRPRKELGADHAGQGLKRPSAALWAAGALVQPDLAAGRLRGAAMSRVWGAVPTIMVSPPRSGSPPTADPQLLTILPLGLDAAQPAVAADGASPRR